MQFLPPLSKLLTKLIKLYLDQEKKFSRELYNVLNLKLCIFYNYCQKVGIESNQYHNTYSVMLRGQASTFYYDHLAGKRYNFNQMIYKTKCHFEIEENKQQ